LPKLVLEAEPIPAVPKIAVAEDNDSKIRENDIRASSEISSMGFESEP
jgi:hypothetical protein